MSQDPMPRGNHLGPSMLVCAAYWIEPYYAYSQAMGGVGGDAITEMLGMMRKSPQTGQAKSIHHMITQLVQRKPSVDPNSSRRTSFYPAVYPDHTHRSSGENATGEDSSTHRSSEDYAQRPPGLDHPRALTTYNHGSRRHTLSTVPVFRVKSPPSLKK